MSFFASFRIVAWQMVYFQADRAENLHPGKFDCNRCFRPEKDKPKGCPLCELPQKLDYYKAEMREQIHKAGGIPKGWTFDRLMDLYGNVADILARNRGHLSKAWDRRTARLAQILLDERQQMRAIDDFERRKKRPATG